MGLMARLVILDLYTQIMKRISLAATTLILTTFLTGRPLLAFTNGQSATYVLGQPNLGTVAPTLSQTGMDLPAGVAYDADHRRLFVADDSNSRVLVYDLSGGLTNGMNAL